MMELVVVAGLVALFDSDVLAMDLIHFEIELDYCRNFLDYYIDGVVVKVEVEDPMANNLRNCHHMIQHFVQNVEMMLRGCNKRNSNYKSTFLKI